MVSLPIFPFPHSTQFHKTTLHTRKGNMEKSLYKTVLLNNIDYKCCKKRNCSLWTISSFATLFSNDVCYVYMSEMVKLLTNRDISHSIDLADEGTKITLSNI